MSTDVTTLGMSAKLFNGLCFTIKRLHAVGRNIEEIAIYLNRTTPKSYYGSDWTPQTVTRFCTKYGLLSND
jgi:hypothetical protein